MRPPFKFTAHVSVRMHDATLFGQTCTCMLGIWIYHFDLFRAPLRTSTLWATVPKPHSSQSTARFHYYSTSLETQQVGILQTTFLASPVRAHEESLQHKQNRPLKKIRFIQNMAETLTMTQQPKRRTQLLRKRRVKQQQKEDNIRSHMSKISTEMPLDSIYSSDSGYSFETASSADSFQTMESSVLSQTRSIARGQSLRWNRFHVSFSFSLLTSQLDAPPEGIYNKEEKILNDDSSVMSSSKLADTVILETIMSKVQQIAQMALEERGGNVVMTCTRDRPPFVISVARDRKCRLGTHSF